LEAARAVDRQIAVHAEKALERRKIVRRVFDQEIADDLAHAVEWLEVTVPRSAHRALVHQRRVASGPGSTAGPRTRKTRAAEPCGTETSAAKSAPCRSRRSTEPARTTPGTHASDTARPTGKRRSAVIDLRSARAADATGRACTARGSNAARRPTACTARGASARATRNRDTGPAGARARPSDGLTGVSIGIEEKVAATATGQEVDRERHQ
jgi:hypothetical protein